MITTVNLNNLSSPHLVAILGVVRACGESTWNLLSEHVSSTQTILLPIYNSLHPVHELSIETYSSYAFYADIIIPLTNQLF